MEKCISVYTFVTFVDVADFLFTWESRVEYHVCLYFAGIGAFFDALTAIVLFLQEEVGPPRNRRRLEHEEVRYSTDEIQSLLAEDEEAQTHVRRDAGEETSAYNRRQGKYNYSFEFDDVMNVGATPTIFEETEETDD